MRLSWNEIRARAAAFAEEFADATYEKGETQSFYNAFFNVFGVKRRSVAVYERRVTKLNNKKGFIDLFMPKVFLVEQKSAGRDLAAAREQAGEYFLGLKEDDRPRYILACDFQTFDLYDLSERTEVSFKLTDLPDHVERFGFIMGVQKVAFKDQDPVNIKAAELIGDVHDNLEAAGFAGADLERFLVRIVFCLFADDTGVFQPRNLFLDWLEERTREDGSDLGPLLAQLFQTLDKPEDKRGIHLDEDLAAFPYINGDLFSGATEIPAFNSEMRESLVVASRFDWSPISPAIFGSLFQSVMNKEERRKQGAHYTTEKNILKLIGPLFLDELNASFERAKNLKRGRKAALAALRNKIENLEIFDPACGCGNFLIIAYRELRRLEHKILIELYPGKQLDLEVDIPTLSHVTVDQFHGIEIGEFPAEIARAAMWMMDHIMNNELSRAFGVNYARIPLEKSANIVCGDALEIDWAKIIAPEMCDYILGNPPFSGAKHQSKFQREQVRNILRLGGPGGTLDYVAAWFIKAGDYLNQTKRPVRFAFVATNSITQGEQVAQLWPILFDRCKLEFAFAHRTFAWGSDARGKAHVHVVIIGLTKRADEVKEKRLYSYKDVNGEADETKHPTLSPYLVELPEALKYSCVASVSKSLMGKQKLITGSKPVDGGYYIFNETERNSIVDTDPKITNYIRPFIGANEFIDGSYRYILAAENVPPDVRRNSKTYKELSANVRSFRLAEIAGKNGRRVKTGNPEFASRCDQFHVTVIPEAPFLAVPQTSSERRVYAPIGWLVPPTIPSDKLRLLPDASVAEFSVLTSAMHMAWMRMVTGRMKSDYMYSVGVVYNTFPWPDLNDKATAKLTETGQAILDARAVHLDTTLADLYDPNAMPANLRKAHRDNDRVVDQLYRTKPFEGERERVEHLFMLYEKLVTPLTATTKQTKRGKPEKR